MTVKRRRRDLRILHAMRAGNTQLRRHYEAMTTHAEHRMLTYVPGESQRLSYARAAVRRIIRDRLLREAERLRALGIVNDPTLISMLFAVRRTTEVQSLRVLLDVTKGM